ncbi:hypothetical protein [Paraburkholderia phenazinium]|uniref:Uncharacterized protein n=1 Tax=Paraburkholderia phenazinium TaxID=60549 RepID=A0A1G7PJJ4_9BURK|nr:hypothetical protein [Paraburkholderia phenazinium]SDF86417.1 hypothetical protein SAMN05216466_101333 [Paraburkholderia phenazinium]
MAVGVFVAVGVVAMAAGVRVRVVVFVAVLVRMRVPILFDNRNIGSMIVPAAPASVRMVMVFRVRMSVRPMAGMTVLMVVRILQNPLRVGVSARFTGFVTVCFGVAVVRHGGFLARFVV